MFAFLARALPSQCLVCHAWPARTLCARCIARFAPAITRCPTCALPLPARARSCSACSGRAPALAHCIAAVNYEWPWRDAIQRFKFQQEIGLAAPLAELMQRAPGAAALLRAADLLLAIPSSPARLAARGFNAPQLLAQHLGRPCQRNLLLRVADGVPQRGLGRAARQANVRGAFAVAAARARPLAGRRILLVDDVMTTGATLHEAARALRRAGAAEVSALVLARD